MVTLDGTMIAAIAAVFSMATGSVGWLVRALWSDRAGVQAKLVEMLTLQFASADGRKDLWTNLEKVVEGQTRKISDLERVTGEFFAEYRRRNP